MPLNRSFGFYLLQFWNMSPPLSHPCSVVHGHPISSVLSNTLISWLIFCLHPLPHPTQEISLEFSLQKKRYSLLPQASHIFSNCSRTSNQLSTGNQVLLHLPIPTSTLIDCFLFSLTQQILWRTYYVLGSIHTVDKNKHNPLLTSFKF